MVEKIQNGYNSILATEMNTFLSFYISQMAIDAVW